MSDPIPTCLNCGKALKSKHRYCPKCGQSAKVKRLNLAVVGKDLQKRLLHADSGIIKLTKGLVLQPGKVALEYVQGKRKKYFNPLKFLFLSVGVSVFINEYFHLLDNMHEAPNPGTEIATRYFNLIILFGVPISAIFSWLLFRKKGFNYAENLILQAYLGGFRTVFFILVFTPLVVWFREHYYQALTVYMGIWLIYFSWAKLQFFGGPTWRTILKAFLVLLCSQIVITLCITAAIFIKYRF